MVISSSITVGMMGVKINRELEEKFRKKVYERMGMKRGNITLCLEEAIEEWVKKTSN